MEYDIAVIGGGHAGCEAALACARMGNKTILFAINLDSIAMMPCNPSIGGTSKGHLVREIDALGGEMAKNIDKSYLQSRMLNTGKGPAVYSLRAQADKSKYSQEMKKVLENTQNLTLKQCEITDITVCQGKITGVSTSSGKYICRAVVLAVGTYMEARCLCGETITYSGPNGLKASNGLAGVLKSHGINMMRFKTGTPARINGRTIDYSKMEIQEGDEPIIPFSFENKRDEINRTQLPCYLTYTNVETHSIINENIHRSPLYAGVIEGTGTRYCPSIEDKIVRFKDKDRHQVFIEPEGENTVEMYVQGLSTSLPEDVQEKMYKSVAGLENCEIMRNAYAIEYDCIDATQLKLTLEFKSISGLFSAGQVNGTSGYEEAAAQGLIAGINAARYVKNIEGIIIDRSMGYIGVLIDDIITKGSKEPYRMMTSRAEYRLLLRQDNADLRLTELGNSIGLINQSRYEKFVNKKQQIENELNRIKQVVIAPSANINNILKKSGSAQIMTGIMLSELVKRPELNYYILKAVDNGRPELPEEVKEQVNIQIKYEGYIKRQLQQVEQFKKLEEKLIPANTDYNAISNLRIEAKQKLILQRPHSIGQASRISGVSPADISVLLIYLKGKGKLEKR